MCHYAVTNSSLRKGHFSCMMSKMLSGKNQSLPIDKIQEVGFLLCPESRASRLLDPLNSIINHLGALLDKEKSYIARALLYYSMLRNSFTVKQAYSTTVALSCVALFAGQPLFFFLMSSWAYYFIRKVSDMTVTEFYYSQQEEIKMAYDNADGSFSLQGVEEPVPFHSAFAFDPLTPQMVWLTYKEERVFNNIRPATKRQATREVFDLAPNDASLSLELFTLELCLQNSVLVPDVHNMLVSYYESYTFFSRTLGYEADSYKSQIKIKNQVFMDLKKKFQGDPPYIQQIVGPESIRLFALTEDPVEYLTNCVDSTAALYVFCSVADYAGLELRFTYQTPAARTFMGDNLENLRISKFVGIRPRRFLPKAFFMMLDLERHYTVFRIDPIRTGPKGPYFLTLFDSHSVLAVRPVFLSFSKGEKKSGVRCFYPELPFCKTDIAENVKGVNKVLGKAFKNSLYV